MAMTCQEVFILKDALYQYISINDYKKKSNVKSENEYT